MKKYINVEKLKAEIRRLKLDVFGEAHHFDLGARVSLGYIERFLDSLSEEFDKSLEEAAKEYADGPECSWVGITALEDAFIAGAKWQKKQLKKATEEELNDA